MVKHNQTTCWKQICLTVFQNFVGLMLKGLKSKRRSKYSILVNQFISINVSKTLLGMHKLNFH